MQKGFALLFGILVTVAVIGLIAVYFYLFNKPMSVDNTNKKDDLTIYTNNNLNFQFQYQAYNLTVKEDSEQEFNQRAAGSASRSVNGDFRKNFKGYVGYEPEKFLGAVVALDKENNFDTNPFTVWVFDNPQDLTIDAWYKNFWYYPFVWGDFTYTGKFTLAPKDEATISGQMAKSGVIDYQPGKPKFIYVSKEKKMYLFRIIDAAGDKILQSFKFTN